MAAFKTFIRRHSIPIYFALTFLISWGGFLLIGGRGFFAGTDWQTDPQFQLAILAMLAGPPVAGIVLTLLVAGMAGLRELFSRLLRWRVGIRWYAVAFLTAPLVEISVLLALSPISAVFLPSIFTAQDKVGLLISGILVGVVGGLVEELGWTGFVIPRLRVRHTIFTTGLVVGIFWGAWHLLQMWWVGSTSSATLPLPLFLSLYFLLAFAQLTAYRVLMVWVYDHTQSLFVAVFMHASYILSTLFVFAPPTTGMPYLTYSVLFTVALWVVAAVVMATSGKFSRQLRVREVGAAGA